MSARIQVVEPFFTGPHRYWAERIQQHCSLEVDLNTLPGRHWKWRMSSGCIDLAKNSCEYPEPDIFLCSDMLDLAAFKGMLTGTLPGKRFILYMHENQLVYPQLNPAEFDRHYAFINFRSAIAADDVWFNSKFHRDAFLEALPSFLKAFPDKRNIDRIKAIREKSRIVPLGIDPINAMERIDNDEPHILWNHRWEHDKDPDAFFELIYELEDWGLNFKLIVLGESYGQVPECFAKAQEKLADRIVHWGYSPRVEYLQWLAKADILPVTSQQEYFGLSVMEAIYAGATPILPDRLVYPELYAHKGARFYNDLHGLSEQCTALIKTHPERDRIEVSEYGWDEVIKIYERDWYL